MSRGRKRWQAFVTQSQFLGTTEHPGPTGILQKSGERATWKHRHNARAGQIRKNKQEKVDSDAVSNPEAPQSDNNPGRPSDAEVTKAHATSFPYSAPMDIELRFSSFLGACINDLSEAMI